MQERPDIIRRAMRYFYDEEQGKIQISGFIGAIVGAFCGFKLIGGSVNTLKDVVAVLFLTGLGTYGARLASDHFEQRNAPPVASGNGQSLTPERGQGRAPQQDSGMPDQFVPPPTPPVTDKNQTLARK